MGGVTGGLLRGVKSIMLISVIPASQQEMISKMFSTKAVKSLWTSVLRLPHDRSEVKGGSWSNWALLGEMSKGFYWLLDRHERKDVVEYRKDFLEWRTIEFNESIIILLRVDVPTQVSIG
jgi:hypothetical protein